jgi:hypothetical protein
MKHQRHCSTFIRYPSAEGACDGAESTETDSLELEAPVANLRAIKAVPTATAANAATMKRIVWLVPGPLASPLLSAWLALDKPSSTPPVGAGLGEGLPATESIGGAVPLTNWGTGVGEGLAATESIGTDVPVRATWGTGVGEGLVIATKSIAATVPEGSTPGAPETITVGVGVETWADVTVAAGVPPDEVGGLPPYDMDMGINIDIDIDIDMDIDVDVDTSSSSRRRAL